VTAAPGSAGSTHSLGIPDSLDTAMNSTDTVATAAATPERAQPWAELGLQRGEYERIRELLGRRPTSAELAMYSVMWSEHCSYKSSKIHLRLFGELAPDSDALLVGIGANAGVVDIGHGWAVTFKAESHNHPSFLEPLQGAATGVGGIVRDILAMGARPVAVMDSLRVGPLDAPDTARVLPGIVAGIGWYGNCLGLPTIGGELGFDPGYAGNPLVNALCVGVMRHEQIQSGQASGVGNLVVLYGARTGGDGIGGASVLASDSFTTSGPTRRPAVQVGDPFAERVLIEATLAAFAAGLVSGISDLGAAGLSCAFSELASAGESGMRVELDRVPLRDPTLTPEEILMSESQERMMAIVTPEHLPTFLDLCARWDVSATAVGQVTDTGRLQVSWHGQQVVDVDPRTGAHDGPVYTRPIARPPTTDAHAADDPDRLPRPRTGPELRATLLRLVGSPELADRSWVTDQYDRYVLGNTVRAQPEDAGVVRIDESTGLGVALSLDGNPRYAALDPFAGAQLALAEAYRNVAACGARPLAVTDCLNFGSPEDPGVMWQFERAVRGLAHGCRTLGTPVTGGNVSFYNQTGSRAILPTPVVGVLGVLDDVARATPIGFATPGLAVYLLGGTEDEFGGSSWAWLEHGHLGGRPPTVRLEAERLLADICINGSRDGMIDGAHDLSEGGLAQALVESCLRGGVGARILVPDGVDPFVFLYSESSARVMVAVPRSEEIRFTDMCTARGQAHVRIGVTDDGGGTAPALEIAGLFSVGLAELGAVHRGPLPAVLDAH